MNDAIRIDKFLWFARFARTRGLAQEVVAAGRMRIGGRVTDHVDAAIHVGDVLTFPLHGHVRVIRVEAIPRRRGPAPEAHACYTDLSPAENENVSQERAEY